MCPLQDKILATLLTVRYSGVVPSRKVLLSQMAVGEHMRANLCNSFGSYLPGTVLDVDIEFELWQINCRTLENEAR